MLATRIFRSPEILPFAIDWQLPHVLFSEQEELSELDSVRDAIFKKEVRMPSKRKAKKKRYTSPSFNIHDAQSAKAELEARGQPKDPNVHRILRSINQQLETSKKPKSDLEESA